MNNDRQPKSRPSMVHELKITPERFAGQLDGNEAFELRLYGRDFKAGDMLYLREWAAGEYTGRSIYRQIVSLLLGPACGLQQGRAILSIAPVEPPAPEFVTSLYPAQPAGFRIGNPTGIMITHTPTGLQSVCESERSQHRNKEIAMQRLKAVIAEKAAAPQHQHQADATITVDAKALRDVLYALTGPGHYIRELQATRSIAKLTGVKNPIDVLLDQFNAQAKG